MRRAFPPFIPSPMRLRPPHKRPRGFSLVEVLVSVLILSFGVLGAVGMQASALKATRDSRLQSAAVRLARDFGELMRGNRFIALQTSASANPYLLEFDGGVPAAPGNNCFLNDCSNPAALAEFEAREWMQRAAHELPGARIATCFDETPFDADGQPVWPCSNSGSLMVVKIGWTRQGHHTPDAPGAAGLGVDRASRPSVVIPVAPGAGL